MRTLAALLLLLSACGGNDDSESPSVGDVNWYGDVEPVFQRVCWRCHNPEGVGRGDWTRYENVRPLASTIAAYVSMGAMPPASADPGCRDYHGSEHMTLSPEEVALVQAWADEGAPEGDPADAVPPGEYSEHLDDFDVELRIPVAHEVDAGSDRNEYACFVVEHGQTEPFYVTALDVDLDAAKVVHHMILVRVPEGVNPGGSYGASADDVAFDCENPILGSGWEALHAWAPGMPPTVFDEGLGMKVEPTDKFVLQMHYYATEPTVDQSAYRLQIAPAVANEVFFTPLGPSGFVIPAGASDHTESETFTNDYGVTLLVQGIFPHMHKRGKAFQAWIEKADGSEECLVGADGWDFDNQATYLFTEAARLEDGETAHVECTWDNSDNDSPVGWGEATDEEMCFFLSYVSVELF